MIEIEARLSELRALGLHSRMRLVSGPQGPHVVLDGKPVLLLCSDNYLGLADHPRVREASADAAMRWGVGTCASRLASGTMTIHRRLEERLAAFARRESALLFGSRLEASAGVIAALARPGDIVFSDEGNHASLIEGCRLSRAEVFVYDHGDVEHLAWGLEQAHGRGALIVTDAMFSLDGELAPLEDIVELAQQHRVRLLVDDAHGTGTLGPGGRGALAALGLEDQVDVIVGSLGKALGSHGAFVACDRVMTQYLLNAARTLAFSTAPPPPAVAGALAALDLLEERPRLVDKLHVNAAALRAGLRDEGFDLRGSSTHLLPIVVGDPELAHAQYELRITHHDREQVGGGPAQVKALVLESGPERRGVDVELVHQARALLEQVERRQSACHRRWRGRGRERQRPCCVQQILSHDAVAGHERAV